MKRLFSIVTLIWLTASLLVHAQSSKVPVFIYAGQSNADGREFVQNLPDYMKVGTAPYAPYQHLKYASICGTPTVRTFGTRTLEIGTRYAFCDVVNYWIDQSATQDFYAIKCAYGGTAIAPGVTAEKLPIWYADAEWMQTHNAYKGDDLTQEAYKNNNSLTKNLTEGFASLVDGTLAAIDVGYDVKAIMWHQGESDRNAGADYYVNFKTMIAYMRQAIYAKTGDEADKTLPFIFGTVCRRSTQYNATVEAAQKQVASEDPNCYVIDMKNATLLSDNLHFDRQATEYLGKKMYNLLVELGLVSGSQVDVEEFPVKESVMDGVSVPTPDNRSWDFTSFSQATQDALSAEVALTSGALWNQHNTYGYRYSGGMEEVQLHTSADYVIPEVEGLFFSSPQGNRVALNTGNGYMVFVTGDPTVFVPKLSAGQLVTFTLAAAKNTIRMKPGLDMADYADVVGGDEVGTAGGTVTFRVKYNVTLPTHIGFQTSDAAYIKKIEVKTPETVNILIGADQIETFASSRPLDFSPFTDLFKAYVVTGYDDATGKVDLEQVLQVPANTGVVLMGEESTVNAPVIDGVAPVLTQDNLLTAVVGSGTAPAGSFVLTTSASVTQFTKTASAANLENQAYLASLGSLSAYGFNIVPEKEEHVYDIVSGSILAKSTVLTFSSKKHHAVTDGTTSKDVYIPTNADGLDGRFAFDNSGNWRTDGNNGSLGYTYGNGNKNNLYASVVSLHAGDRVKIEVNTQTTIIVLNDALRGMAAGGTLTSGNIYTVQADDGETVNVDFKINGSSNRFGITKMTVWTSVAEEPANTAVCIAPYDGNRKAAISYTFDDGIQDQYTLAYPEMKRRGLRATFAIIGSKVGGTIRATGVPDVPAMTWDQICEMHADGFEIASHGWEHKGLPGLTEEALHYEVEHNDEVITAEVGQFPLTFVYPGNSKSDEVVAYVESNRVGSRTSQTSFGGGKDLLTMNNYVNDLISSGSWGVTMTHAIAEGYDHFDDPTQLYNHWDYVTTLTDQLWVAPFCEVAAYVKERDNAQVVIESDTDDAIVLSLSMTLNPELFRQPLTLLVGAFADAAEQDGRQLEVIYRGGETIINGVSPVGGSVTIHKSATAPLPDLDAPSFQVSLTDSPANSTLKQPEVTLTHTNAAATLYYRVGTDGEWTAVSEGRLVPSVKGIYAFKAVADGYNESAPSAAVALAPYYSIEQTIDLTDDNLYTASTNATGAFSWGDNWGFDASQEFGKLSTNKIGGLTVQNSNLAARYSYARGIGLANNYGYTYGTNVGTAYSFAEYVLYQNHSLTDLTTRIVHNPTATTLVFPSQKEGALKAIRIYEPCEVATVTVSDIGYATYCSNHALDFTGSGVEAYYATANGNDVDFNNAITNPAPSTGLLLKAPEGTYTVAVAKSGTDVSSTNLLVANFETKIVGSAAGCDYGKVFILSKHNGKVGFFKANDGRELLPGKSYLYIENPSGTRLTSGYLFDEETSALDSMRVIKESASKVVYNLNGQRMASPRHGLYIESGKKMIK